MTFLEWAKAFHTSLNKHMAKSLSVLWKKFQNKVWGEAWHWVALLYLQRWQFLNALINSLHYFHHKHGVHPSSNLPGFPFLSLPRSVWSSAVTSVDSPAKSTQWLCFHVLLWKSIKLLILLENSVTIRPLQLSLQVPMVQTRVKTTV